MDILSRFNHVNLVSLFGIQLDLLYLVQEHSHFGSLQDYFRTISNQQTNDSTFQKYHFIDLSLLNLSKFYLFKDEHLFRLSISKCSSIFNTIQLHSW